MTRPRSELVSIADTPYYHCICRCVRRAFLCGRDKLTETDYSHRKGWVLERLAKLSQVYTIDICAYAVMSNHYHLVVRLDPDTASQLSEREVVERWRECFKIPKHVAHYIADQAVSDALAKKAQGLIKLWRQRLSDLSWFMRSLNEYIAREANKEDKCTGRFWEGRFKSQAILDDAGLLACMAYVDLNPLRAEAVSLPENSADVSIHQRLKLHHQLQASDSDKLERPAESESSESSKSRRPPLLLFSEQSTESCQHKLPFTFEDYLQLLDWAGRIKREDKAGVISAHVPPILQRTGLDSDSFSSAIFSHDFSRGTVVGQQDTLEHFARSHNRQRVIGPVLSQASASSTA